MVCSFSGPPSCLVPRVVLSFYVYALLIKREVKMAGYWPSSFLHFYAKTQKRKRPLSSHLDRTSLFNKYG